MLFLSVWIENSVHYCCSNFPSVANFPSLWTENNTDLQSGGHDEANMERKLYNGDLAGAPSGAQEQSPWSDDQGKSVGHISKKMSERKLKPFCTLYCIKVSSQSRLFPWRSECKFRWKSGTRRRKNIASAIIVGY